MPATFWSNTIWYILLSITTIIELIFIFARAKNRKHALAVYFTLVGIVFLIELIVFARFSAYNYFPMIIPKSVSDDSAMGNFFSQLSLAATALLVTVYELKYYWYLIPAGTYYVIEELFIYLGIYKHYWYRTWMTFIGILILCWVAKKIYTNSIKNTERIWRSIYVVLGAVSIFEPMTYTLRLLGIHIFGKTFSSLDVKVFHTVAAYQLILGGIILALYYSKIKLWWKATVILFLYLAHFIAFKLNLMIYREGWFFGATTIIIFGMFLIIYILDKLYPQDKEYIS